MQPIGAFSISYCSSCRAYHVFFNNFELMTFEDPNDAKEAVFNLVDVCQFSYFEAKVAMDEYEIGRRQQHLIYLCLHNPTGEFLQ